MRTPRSRFYPKVRVVNECWEWDGSRNANNYGLFYFRGRSRTASKVSWIIHYGEVPLGLCVLHRCDNPPCVNPTHLFLGTQGDNMNDKAAKLRNGTSKLNPDAVRDIRKSYRGIRGDIINLARKHLVSRKTIHNVIDGKIWNHVKGGE